jgi:hypothetical protein
MEAVYRVERIPNVQVSDKIRDVSGALAGENMEVLGKYQMDKTVTLIIKHSTGTIERNYDYPLARALVLEPRYLMF